MMEIMSQHGDPGQQGQVLSLGSINADFQVRTGRRPEISETVVADDFRRLSGGKAANVAFFAHKLGVDTRLFAHAGDDDLAEQALGPLRSIGVDLSGVSKVAGKETGVAMIMVQPDGKKVTVMAANANNAWSDEDARQVAQAVRAAPHGSVLVADCEIALSVLEQALHAARQRGMKTILDPSPPERVTDAMLALTDIAVPNSSEAKSLTGEECRNVTSAITAGSRLRERGVAAACIKLSDGGCVLVDADLVAHIPPVPVEIIDTTGAGDAFAGALAVAMLEQHPLGEAVCFAVAASHLAITGYGSQPSYPSRDEVSQMKKRLTAHTDIDR